MAFPTGGPPGQYPPFPGRGPPQMFMGPPPPMPGPPPHMMGGPGPGFGGPYGGPMGPNPHMQMPPHMTAPPMQGGVPPNMQGNTGQQGPPGPPGAAPPAKGPSHPDWNTYHTPEGVPYFVHKTTKETVWTLPDAGRQRLWKEYFNAEKVPYYYNTVLKITVWEKPKDFEAFVDEGQDKAQASTQAAQASTISAPTASALPAAAPEPTQQAEAVSETLVSAPAPVPTPAAVPTSSSVEIPVATPAPSASQDQEMVDASTPSESKQGHPQAKQGRRKKKKKKKKEPESSGGVPLVGKIRVRDVAPATSSAPKPANTAAKPKWNTTEEREAAFQALLKDKNIKDGLKWAEVLPKIVFDPRYRAVVSMADKKRLLEAYQERYQLESEKMKAEKEASAKAGFLEMLKELPDISGQSRYRDVERLAGADPRFLAVDDIRLRQDFSYDYIDALAAAEREVKRAQRVRSIDAFKALLQRITKGFEESDDEEEKEEKDQKQEKEEKVEKKQQDEKEKTGSPEEAEQKKPADSTVADGPAPMEVDTGAEVEQKETSGEAKPVDGASEMKEKTSGDVKGAEEDEKKEMTEEEKKKAEEEKKQAELEAALPDTGLLRPGTQWREVVGMLADMPVFQALEQSDRVHLFDIHMKDVMRSERERLARAKEKRRQKERQYRDEFRALLEERSRALAFNAKSEWRDVEPSLRDTKQFKNIHPEARDSPRTLFQDFCDDLADKLHDHKKALKKCVKELRMTVSASDTPASLLQQLSDKKEFEVLSMGGEENKTVYTQLILMELIAKAEEKQRVKAKRRLESQKQFIKLLRKKISYDYKPSAPIIDWPPADTPSEKVQELLAQPVMAVVSVKQLWQSVKTDRMLQLSTSTSIWSKLNEEEREAAFSMLVDELRQDEAERQEEERRYKEKERERQERRRQREEAEAKDGEQKKGETPAGKKRGSASRSRSASNSRSSSRHKRKHSSSNRKHSKSKKHKHRRSKRDKKHRDKKRSSSRSRSTSRSSSAGSSGSRSDGPKRAKTAR